ncbi:MAG: potassium channel family protein [Streptosporangiaceae bacterium]
MTNPPARMVAPARRRLVVLGVLRSLAAATVLVALYYLLPLDHLANVPLWVILVVGLVVLLAVATWQLRLVLRSDYPGVRAAEALATTVALFLLLFAAVYFVMERAGPASFSHHLTRTDSLYFTVTTFSTVGYGDITAASQAARLLVTVQMVLDLLALGLGIKVFIGVVQLARQGRPAPAGPAAGPDQPRQPP